MAGGSIFLGGFLPTGKVSIVGEKLCIVRCGNAKPGKGATLSLGDPTTRSRPSESTKVIAGVSGGIGGESIDLPNMASVSRTMGSLTIGSRDRDFWAVVPFDFARSSSGSRCSAPGALEAALAFSRDTVRRWVLGILAFSSVIGRSVDDRVPSLAGAGFGDGVVRLLIVGDGVVSKGWYVLGCSKGGAGSFSTSCGVLAL